MHSQVPTRPRGRGGPVVIVVVWLLVSIALVLTMIRSSAQAGPAVLEGPPQRIQVIGTNDPAFRKAYPHMHCSYPEGGSRYGTAPCRP